VGGQHAHKFVGGFHVNMITNDKVMLARHDDDGLCQTCRTFQTICMFTKFFQKSILSRVTTKFLLQQQTFQKTVIITPFGLFGYLFTSFGLSNIGQTFQRRMDHTVDGHEGLFAYMDDICVGSLDRQTHLLNWEAFFYVFAANGLAIKLEKCVFAVPTLGPTILAA
jgi:hypothetical protein